MQIPDLQTIEYQPAQDFSASQPAGATATSSVGFQQYLEEEQKRLSLIFSPFGQFDFSTWFSYPSFTETKETKPSFFSDIELQPNKYSSSAVAQNSSPPTNATAENKSPTDTPVFSKSVQTQIQTLLQKSGWLTPNLAALPLFSRAQIEGKLLTKLDLQSLVDEIVSRIEMVREKGTAQLTLGLRPKELGEILLTLTAKSGMISIQIQAPEETRKILDAEIKNLEAALKKARINLNEIKVSAVKEANDHA